MVLLDIEQGLSDLLDLIELYKNNEVLREMIDGR